MFGIRLTPDERVFALSGRASEATEHSLTTQSVAASILGNKLLFAIAAKLNNRIAFISYLVVCFY